MEFNGLPLHPLVVHAVVVFAPLAAMSAVAYAVLPRWRWALRWPMVATTVIAVVTALVAVQAGEALMESRGLGQSPEVQTHEERGELLRTILLVFTVVVGVGAWRLGGPSGLKSGGGERKSSGGPLDVIVMGLLVVGAVAVAVMVFLVGDSGSRAHWGA